jgi:hypothetical protein
MPLSGRPRSLGDQVVDAGDRRREAAHDHEPVEEDGRHLRALEQIAQIAVGTIQFVRLGGPVIEHLRQHAGMIRGMSQHDHDAMPLRGGTCWKKPRSASIPPAEAPMPTIRRSAAKRSSPTGRGTRGCATEALFSPNAHIRVMQPSGWSARFAPVI